MGSVVNSSVPSGQYQEKNPSVQAVMEHIVSASGHGYVGSVQHWGDCPPRSSAPAESVRNMAERESGKNQFELHTAVRTATINSNQRFICDSIVKERKLRRCRDARH
jgi:hypothetical protein